MTTSGKNLTSWKFDSLNFDIMRTKIFKEREQDRVTVAMKWVGYTIVGICCALVTTIMMHIEVFTTHEKRYLTDLMISGDSNRLTRGWLYFSGFSVLLVFLASLATVFYGPGANGSGNPEIIAYLNGVNYPKLIAFETFVVKIFGVLGAVLGGLCVGKEGPLAHIGANIGAIVPYLPLPRFEYLRNDRTKREFISAGVSAGVSTAFGAPIGGALFAYEMSGMNSFWRFSNLWKSFYTCSVAVFFVAIFHQLMKGKSALEVQPLELKFGETFVISPDLSFIPCAIIVGIVCGVLGSVFIIVNVRLSKLRKKWIVEGWQKVAEAVVFSFVTTSVFYWAPLIFDSCKPSSQISAKNQELLLQYNC